MARAAVLIGLVLVACGDEGSDPGDDSLPVGSDIVFELSTDNRRIDLAASPDDRIFVSTEDDRFDWSNGELLEIDISSGAVLWEQSLGVNIDGVTASNDRVYVTTRTGDLRAFSHTGDALWTDSVEDALYGKPVATPAGLVAYHTTDAVRILDRTGAVAASPGAYNATIGHSFQQASVAPDGSLTAVLYKTVGTEVHGWRNDDIAEHWQETVGLTAARTAPTAITGGGAVVGVETIEMSGTYTDEFAVVSLDATGNEEWQVPVAARLEAAPIVDDAGFVYAATVECELVRIDPGGYRRWTRNVLDDYLSDHPDVVSTSSRCDSPLFIAHDRLFVDIGGELYAYSLDGENRWRARGNGSINSVVFTADGVLLASADRISVLDPSFAL